MLTHLALGLLGVSLIPGPSARLFNPLGPHLTLDLLVRRPSPKIFWSCKNHGTSTSDLHLTLQRYQPSLVHQYDPMALLDPQKPQQNRTDFILGN